MKVCAPPFFVLVVLVGAAGLSRIGLKPGQPTGLGSGLPPPTRFSLPPVGHEDESGWRTFFVVGVVVFFFFFFKHVSLQHRVCMDFNLG